MGTTKIYSQNSEQSVIMEFYKDKPEGKFVDIGAYDTFMFSNVRALYEKGNWRGVLVEPSPKNYKAIADNYANDEKIIVLNLAIGENSGEIDFYACEDAVSTSDEGHMKKWGAAGVKFEKIKVPQMSVKSFMFHHCRDADFLSIDTESTNMVVFNNIPDWVFSQISLFCIEHDRHQEEIENRLLPFGFTTLYVNAENIILGRL